MAPYRGALRASTPKAWAPGSTRSAWRGACSRVPRPTKNASASCAKRRPASCVLIGTHALWKTTLRFERLTRLVVIDEQQRFGVEQRAALLMKGASPRRAVPRPRPSRARWRWPCSATPDAVLHPSPPARRARRTTHVLAKADQGQAYDAARAALERGERNVIRGVPPLSGRTAPPATSSAGGRRRETDEEGLRGPSASSDGDFRRQRHGRHERGRLPAGNGVRRLAR